MVHRSYPMQLKRKGNARVESALLWRSIDLMAVVSDHVLVKAYGSVRHRTIKGSFADAELSRQNGCLRMT